MRVLCAVLFATLLALPAEADVPSYCAAYARDFADQSDRQKFNWQSRYDNAEAACLERFAQDTPKPAGSKVKVKTKPKPKVIEAKAKPAAQPKLKVPDGKPQEQAANAVPKLETGSPEWNAYCKKKYVSWNEAKGTYLSRTGVTRKCLVTAD